VNYTLPISRAELFIETEMFNLFNEQNVVSPDTTVITRSATSASCTVGGVAARCVGFNPFLQTPVEGLNYVKGPNFGKPIGTSSYQLARTYQLSVGVRF
jgi:hypothetical protein